MPTQHKKLQAFTHKYGAWLILAGVMVVASVLRLWSLASLPPALHPSEAVSGLMALDLIHLHRLPLISSSLIGLIGAPFVILQALPVWLLHNSITALRLVPAICGVLTVLVVYLWATDWFGRRVGLLSAFVLAVNPWIITLTRNGWPQSLAMLLVTLMIYWGGRAIQTGKYRYYIASTIALGLGVIVSNLFIIVVAALTVCLVYLLVMRRSWLFGHQKSLMIGAATFVILLTPLIYSAAIHRSRLHYVAVQTVWNHTYNPGKVLPALADGVSSTLLAFHLKGDQNYLHNLGGEPLLNTFFGLMALLGLMLAISNFRRPKFAFLVMFFAIGLVPAMLSYGDTPNSLKLITIVPVLVVLTGLGINYLLARWYETFPINAVARNIGLSIVIMLLSLSLIQGYKQYFVAWAGDPKTYQAYDEATTDISHWLLDTNTTRQGGATFVLVDNSSVATITYLTYAKTTYTQLSDEALTVLPLTISHPTFVVYDTPGGVAQLEVIKLKYPGGRLSPHFSSFDGRRLYYVYEVSQ